MTEAAATYNFMGPEAARQHYGLTVLPYDNATELDRTLALDQVAKIAMPIGDAEFKELTDSYEGCIEECPDVLAKTFYILDSRYGNEVGNVRKEMKVDPQTGQQIEDPKNYIHVTEGAIDRWWEQFKRGPKSFREFLDISHDRHLRLIGVAKEQIAQLEETHPGISELYFPQKGEGPGSRNFMRLLSYDGYAPTEGMGAVAKAHNDIGGFTIQAYASAPGFWGAPGGYKSEPIHYDTSDGEAYFFAGATHRKLYGASDPLKPLWHGVDRIIPVGADYVPKRHTVVMFIDPPRVDPRVTKQDTLPHLEASSLSVAVSARAIGRAALGEAAA